MSQTKKTSVENFTYLKELNQNGLSTTSQFDLRNRENDNTTRRSSLPDPEFGWLMRNITDEFISPIQNAGVTYITSHGSLKRFLQQRNVDQIGVFSFAFDVVSSNTTGATVVRTHTRVRQIMSRNSELNLNSQTLHEFRFNDNKGHTCPMLHCTHKYNNRERPMLGVPVLCMVVKPFSFIQMICLMKQMLF